MASPYSGYCADVVSHTGEPSRNYRAKRPHGSECSHDDDEPPAKRSKPTPAHHDHDHDTWQYPPEFWDGLSTIPLIHDALKELDRRTNSNPTAVPSPPDPSQDFIPTGRGLARFARHGGPDLRDLRGYPATTSPRPATMSSSSRQTKSTDPTTVQSSTGTATKAAKSITPYHRGFEQHLTDHGIYPTYKSRKPDLGDVKTALAVPRPSLSPSRFSDGAFETFQESDALAKDEADVVAHVVPIITGPRQTDHPSAINTPFMNLEKLTNGTLGPAKPDLYYGAYPEQLNRTVRDEIGSHIVPSTMEDKPVAPNFFVEVKGPDGALSVMERQARYDGAIGARAMHTLQCYGEDEPVYDGNAYAFSATYYGGHLKMYAHQPASPTSPQGRPEYHMTQLRSISMTDTRESFVEGATTFRNARDLAKTYRGNFIQAANARVPGAQSTSGLESTDATNVPHEESASWDDGVDYSASYGGSREQPEADDDRVDSFRGYAQQQGFDRQGDRQAGQEQDEPAQATSSKRRRDSESPQSRSSRQKPRITWEYVEVKYDSRKDAIRFADPLTGDGIKSRRKDWADSTVMYQGKEEPCWLLESETLGRTFYTWTIQ